MPLQTAFAWHSLRINFLSAFIAIGLGAMLAPDSCSHVFLDAAQHQMANTASALGQDSLLSNEKVDEMSARSFALSLSARPISFAFLALACIFACPPAHAQNELQQKQIQQHEQKLAEARATKDRKNEAQQLLGIASLYSKAGMKDRALDYDTQALVISRELKSPTIESNALNDIGSVNSDLGQKQKAVEYLDEALKIRRESADRKGEAATLTSIASVYDDLGQLQRSMDFLNRALPITREQGDRVEEATTLDGIGSVYGDMSQMPKALEYFTQALAIRREVGDRNGEATTLSHIGLVNDLLGEHQKALEFYNLALPIQRQAGDRAGEALTLNNIGFVYDNRGEKQQALEFYSQALLIQREVGDRSNEAQSLNNIGMVYVSLGQYQKARELFDQALPIERQVGNKSLEGITLSNVGWVCENLGEKKEALTYYNQVLPILREAGNRRGEAITLLNVGGLYRSLGQPQKTLEYYSEVLPVLHAVGDRLGEGVTLANLGVVYSELGQSQKALSSELAGLALVKTVEDPDKQGQIDARLMTYFRDQKRPEVAILFGVDSVNCFQQIRKNISGMDKDVQSGFAQSKSDVYRELAELLVQTDRLGEAEQVLDLLKEQELKEVVRGAAADGAAKVEPLKLSAEQQKAQEELATPEKTASDLAGLSQEYTSLLAMATRTPDENARLKVLDAKIETGNSEVSGFFQKTLFPELAQKTGIQGANDILIKERSDVSQLQNTLAALGPGVLGIRLLLGQENAYAILITARARKKLVLKATPSELREKILQVREDLRSPSSNPRPHLEELYAMVVAPLQDELKALDLHTAHGSSGSARVPTLLWSLDGVLRYVPIAALYDGQRYMVERFNNVLFTPESYGHMTPSSGPGPANLSVLAMGLSRSYGGLPALPGVLPELEAVVHDPAMPASHGPLEGKLLPNEQFTLAALKRELGSGKSFAVVHIASHYVAESGSGDEPYLMLGGEDSGAAEGYELTLSKLENSAITFHGTQLLTLSACSTAKGDAARDGQEMDSLGMIAQQKDAEAVLATLWNVNDKSTSQLMGDFYARWVKHPADGKAEALRQAQLQLLRGSGSATPVSARDRGLGIPNQDPGPSLSGGNSHPYYWAPFVLIGNFQ